MAEKESEIIKYRVPPTELLTAIGMLNFIWANLDAVVSAAYVATLDGDAVELGITLGRMETKPKLDRLKKIYKHRKSTEMTELMERCAREVEEMRNMRNCLTHGFYQGATMKGEHVWAILPDFHVTEDFSGTSMFTATLSEISDHQSQAARLVLALLETFGKRLHKLLYLPSQTPSAGRSTQRVPRKNESTR